MPTTALPLTFNIPSVSILPCVLFPDMFAIAMFAIPVILALADLSRPFNVVISPVDVIFITSAILPMFALPATLNKLPLKFALPVASKCNEVHVPVIFEVNALINPVLAYKLPAVSNIATFAIPVTLAFCDNRYPDAADTFPNATTLEVLTLPADTFPVILAEPALDSIGLIVIDVLAPTVIDEDGATLTTNSNLFESTILDTVHVPLVVMLALVTTIVAPTTVIP